MNNAAEAPSFRAGWSHAVSTTPAHPREGASTFILRLAPPAVEAAQATAGRDAGEGQHSSILRVAVKDLIDMAGLPTTAGSRALATSDPAGRDAACLAGTRAAEASGLAAIVGKTNLHELAFGVSGINAVYGTPVNPIDSHLVPGGSSSGSAAAVGSGEADIGLGTDTGGSVRIPAACCGVAGLKTTWGRVPIDGVRALAPSLDTVGPIARDVAGLIAGMALLEPGFPPDIDAGGGATSIGWLRIGASPEVSGALEAARACWPLMQRDVDAPGWSGANEAAITVLMYEAWQSNGVLLRERPDDLGADVAERLWLASSVTKQEWERARKCGTAWREELLRLLDTVAVIALPTLSELPPTLAGASRMARIRHTLPVNLAGMPALSLPLPAAGPVPASLQLIGRPGAEEMLLATGVVLEGALHRAARRREMA
ncbi:MAG: amidase [Acidimicrobiales bacterium]